MEKADTPRPIAAIDATTPNLFGVALKRVVIGEVWIDDLNVSGGDRYVPASGIEGLHDERPARKAVESTERANDAISRLGLNGCHKS